MEEHNKTEWTDEDLQQCSERNQRPATADSGQRCTQITHMAHAGHSVSPQQNNTMSNLCLIGQFFHSDAQWLNYSKVGGGTYISSDPFPFHPLSSLPLEVGPVNPARGSIGSAVSSPRGVWGRAPSEIEFGAFKP